MDLNEIGYNVALGQMGLLKEAGAWSRVGGFFKNVFGKTPAKVGPTPGAMDDVERAMSGRAPRKPPGQKANARAEQAFSGGKPQGATPPAQGAAGAPAPEPPKGGGMLGFMRKSPLMGAGVAGLGAGGLGYVMGAGSQPPGMPQQQYGQPQMQPGMYQ